MATHQPKPKKRNHLPIDDSKEDILKTLENNQVVVIVGETGSGKTTQFEYRIGNTCFSCVPLTIQKLAQFIIEAPYFHGLVVVTQPRRVAAVSVAQRVAFEQNSKIGDLVGYTIRFEDCTTSKTKIKYVTDGVLVREFLIDRNLNRYNVIILDEAHERSMHTDVLLGLVKRALKKRKDLKVIITSATLDVNRFSTYFNKCPILTVPGREYPVDIYHSKTIQVMTSDGPSTKAYIHEAIDLVLKIHKTQTKGHILVFLTGQDEIDRACSELRQRIRLQLENEDKEDDDEEEEEEEEENIGLARPKKLQILPLYAMLSVEEQTRVFEDLEDAEVVRKCVIATNIAETSVTVPGVRFVVDPGYVKQKAYDPSRGMESLIIVPTSKVSAQQRAGRAGRTASGQCFRLYSNVSFQSMMDETIPEILRMNLSSVILALKTLNIIDVLNFDYFESPSEAGIEEALLLLHTLGALNVNGTLTDIGLKMSQLPLDPKLSRMLLQAHNENCMEEALIITSMVSTETIWNQRQLHRQQATDARYRDGRYGDERGRYDGASEEDLILNAHSKFSHPKGDHMTLLNVWEAWADAGFRDSWVREHYLRSRAMRVAKLTHQQLSSEIVKLNLNSASSSSSKRRRKGENNFTSIMRAFTAGFCLNTARRCSDGIYKLLPQCSRGPQRVQPQLPFVYLQPSSSNGMFENPTYLLYQDLMATSKPYLKCVLAIDDYDWLQQCRSPMKLEPTALALCGQAVKQIEASQPTTETCSSSSSSLTKDLLTKEGAKRSTAESKEHVASARDRYLARKKMKN